VAKRPNTSTRTGRICPMTSPAVAGRRSADQRLTMPSSPSKPNPSIYVSFPFSALHHPQPTLSPPSAYLTSLLPLRRRPVHTPLLRATLPAQPHRPLLHIRSPLTTWRGEAAGRGTVPADPARRCGLPPGATSWRSPSADPVVVRQLPPNVDPVVV
jgi:hypothetical protein